MNFLLSTLPAAKLELVQPHLEPVELNKGQFLERNREAIPYVYFLDSGLASVIAHGPPGDQTGVGMIGRDGMTGISVILDGDHSPYTAFVQIAGYGRRIKTARLREAVKRSERIRSHFNRYVQAFIAQIAHTGLAARRAKIDRRVARWLLMAHDRLEGQEISITHESLAKLLGVRRAGITDALHLLEEKRLIRSLRGVVLILDRDELARCAEGFYGPSEAEQRRLTGWKSK